MGKIDYTGIRKAFLAEFEKTNALELQNRDNVRELEKKINRQSSIIEKIENEIEEIRPEYEDISNLQTLFNMGGMALPANNSAKEKLNDKKKQLRDAQMTLNSLKAQRNNLTKGMGKKSNYTYQVYQRIKKTDLSAISIGEISEYNNYDKIDRGLAFIFVVTQIECNRIADVEKSYLDELLKLKSPVQESSYELMTDKILDYRFCQELKAKASDEILERIYHNMSNAKINENSYEEYCLSKIDSIDSTDDMGMWIADKLNRVFLKKGKSLFSEAQAKTIDNAFEFVLRMEARGSYNSFVLWKNINLHEKMLTGDCTTKCEDVDSAFRVWMFRYRSEIAKVCMRPGNAKLRQPYRSYCAEFGENAYCQLINELVSYAVSESCKKKKFWEGVEFREIVNTVCNYDEKNPVFAKELNRLRKEQNEKVKKFDNSNTAPGEKGKDSGKRTSASTPHISYRLTASHMVVMMMEAVLVPCIISSGGGLFSALIGAGTEGFWGCVVLFFLHTKDERMDRAETIVSSFSGFAINTIIVGGLMMLERLYLMKMGVDSFACAMGVVAAAVVYVIYLLFILFSKKVNGGDK